MTPARTRRTPWLALALCAASGCTLPLRMRMNAVPHVDAPREERARAWRRYRLAVVDVPEELSGVERAGQVANAITCTLSLGASGLCPAGTGGGRTVRSFRIGNTPSLLDRDAAMSVWMNAPELTTELRSSEIVRGVGLGTMGVGGAGLLVAVGMALVQRQSSDSQHDATPMLAVGIPSLVVSLVGWFLTTRVGGGSADADAARTERYNRWLLGRLGFEAGGEFVVDPMVATPADSR